MKTLARFVDAKLDLHYAEIEFKQELCDTLNLDVSNIKSIELYIYKTQLAMIHKVSVELVGSNTFKAKDVAKVEGLSIVTPNKLEIEVSVTPL